MFGGIFGLFIAFLVLLNGFAALRRPYQRLIEHDPLGKRVLAARGEVFTRRAYRVFGAVLVLLGLALAYVSLQTLR
jgi:hypothetical protein